MNKIIKFVQEATGELSKVSWPARATVIRLTIGVIIVATIFGVFIAMVDIVLEQGFEQLLSLRGSSQTQVQDNIQINPEDIQIETETSQ